MGEEQSLRGVEIVEVNTDGHKMKLVQDNGPHARTRLYSCPDPCTRVLKVSSSKLSSPHKLLLDCSFKTDFEPSSWVANL